MKSWKGHVAALVAGLLFAMGLGVAGMTQPQKIIGFLDVTGAWDPSLIWVMGGALFVHMISFRLVTKRKHPLFESNFYIPDRKDINLRLIGGSALFGIGWGLSGLCPGPAVVSLATLHTSVIAFLFAMLVGMLIANRLANSN